MRTESTRGIAAVVSVASAALAVYAFTNVENARLLGWSSDIAMSVAAAGAAVGAVMTMLASRKQFARRKKVFLIAAHQDLDVAKGLAKSLKAEGLEPWLPHEQVAPGQVWEKAILRGIDESAVALLLVSGYLENSRGAQFELAVAKKLLQARSSEFSPVVPVRLDDTPMPKDLMGIRAVDIREPGSVAELLRGLRRAGLAVQLKTSEEQTR